MGNITIRLAPGFTDILGCATEPAASSPGDNAAFGVQPQGYDGELIGRAESADPQE
jgi:hypothetical protein